MWGLAGLDICVRVLRWGVGSLCAVFSNNVFLVKNVARCFGMHISSFIIYR